MNDYILLLRNDPAVFDPANIGPQRVQEIYGRYRAWREQLSSEGILAGSHKLEAETGRVMRAASGNGKAQIIDGPYVETKEVLGGFFVVKAESYEAAVQIARGCPHFEFGSVEVRRIEM